MNNCSECGKEYTDDDAAMDDALLSGGRACRHCIYWSMKPDGWEDKRRCSKLLEGGNGFVDDMAVDGSVLITAPDFYCAMFKFIRKE